MSSRRDGEDVLSFRIHFLSSFVCIQLQSNKMQSAVQWSGLCGIDQFTVGQFAETSHELH